jgi:hypothetical protein
LCVTSFGSHMRLSSANRKTHCRMNHCHIGSSVGSSGEGVCALSSSLVEIFLPSYEPTLSYFNPVVHPVLKEIQIPYRPSHNCADASKMKAIGSSSALIHCGADLIRWFDRRSYFSTVGSSDATLTRGSHLS